jgi:hypothetical protein
MLDAVVSSISRKARMSFSGFNEFWLLVCCGVPTMGAIASTFVMTPLRVAPVFSAYNR